MNHIMFNYSLSFYLVISLNLICHNFLLIWESLLAGYRVLVFMGFTNMYFDGNENV